jgi:hypothetical protein
MPRVTKMTRWAVRRRGEIEPIIIAATESIAVMTAEDASSDEPSTQIEVLRDGEVWCTFLDGRPKPMRNA